MRQAIATDQAPKAIGPYSQAIKAGNLLYCSGQIPLDPATGALVQGDLAAQTRRVLDNVGAILAAAGTSFDRVVKTTVFLADMNDFAAMNEVYATYFTPPAPARSTVAAAGLPKGARIEIEVIAHLIAARSEAAPYVLNRPLRTARSTPITPSTDFSDFITFSRCFRSLISTVMLIWPR